MIYDVNKTVKIDMDNKLILTYGLSNNQMGILEKQFSNVKDVSDNFLSLIEIPSVTVVVNWDKLNDDEIEIFVEEFYKDKRAHKNATSILSDYYRDDIPLIHVQEFECDTLNNTIDEIKYRLSFLESFNKTTNKMKNIIKDIEKVIEGPAKNCDFRDKIRMIEKCCLPYEYLTKILYHFPKLKSLKKIPYRIELNCVLNALKTAFGLLKAEDIDFKHSSGLSMLDDDGSGLNERCAQNYVINLANIIKNHYEENLMKNDAI